jgi:hypothetical protein
MLRSLLLAAMAAATLAAETVPFKTTWRENPASPANVSFLLEAPAGKDGFIKVANGHLVKPGGKRFRIWGINITGAATLPTKEEAPVYAAFLARHGINCVRFHFLDLRAPGGLIDNSREDTRALDPQQFDKLDSFVSELKKRGIYTNLNLNVARAYKRGDGVRDHEIIGYGKAITYYDDRLLELQREYARQLLTHRNQYTGNEYRNEPAVALVELVNENSIVESWFSNRLLGRNTSKTSGTWSDIPASYEEALTAKYHAHLKAKGLDPVARLRRDQFDAAPADRFRREAEFYMELEREYFRSMGDYLKKELGVKPLVLGTSDHNHSNTGYPLLASTSQLDVVDGHVYWQHPSYERDPATGRTTAFAIRNTPMVNDPLHSTVVELSRSAVAGKPYTVSEVNHPFPAEYAAEGIPILGAYAAFHDWDGIFWYTFEHATPSRWNDVQTGHFDFRADPVKMAQVAAGAVAFLRGDVSPARTSVPRYYSMDQVRDGIRLPRKEGPYFTPGFPLSVPLRHTTRIASFTDGRSPAWKDEGEGPFATDTGQIVWQYQSGTNGLVTVDTPRSQALIGFVKANARSTSNLGAAVKNDHCALTLSSLDGKPIAQSAKLLLTTGSRVENTGMTWNEKRTTLTNWGKAPVRIEPVTGSVVLRNLVKAASVSITPLDEAGNPRGTAIPATRSTEGWTVPIGTTPSVWYAVSIRR